MKGTIIINPFDSSAVQQHKVKRMTEEFSRLNADITVVSNDRFLTYVDQGEIVSSADADFALYFDKDKYVARMLEARGIRTFNTARATEICDDKMLTHIALANCGINMPTTLSGALCYVKDGEIDGGYLRFVADRLGFPLVVKECYGSFGEQVYLVKDLNQLRTTVNAIKSKPYLFQKFIGESAGRDMRVIVIGGKVACGMLRQSAVDFRSNVQHGGQATAVRVPDDIAGLCEKVARIIGLDYCGIDVLLGGAPAICEVNSNAMFAAMERTTGVNVARLYAEHIVDCVKHGR